MKENLSVVKDREPACGPKCLHLPVGLGESFNPQRVISFFDNFDFLLVCLLDAFLHVKAAICTLRLGTTA